MDTRTGRIYPLALLQKIFGETFIRKHPKRFRPVTPTAQQLNRRPPQVGRNDPCPCGSGRKFKHCCLKRRGR